MRHRALRGAAATTISQVIKSLVQLGSVVILAKLLAPADFGVYAMVAPIVGFALMFQDFGLSQAIVTCETLTQAQAATMFRVNVGIAAIMAMLLAGVAPVLSAFYGEPLVTGIAAVMSLQVPAWRPPTRPCFPEACASSASPR